MIYMSQRLFLAFFLLAPAVGAGALEAQPPQQPLGVDSSYYVTLGGVDQYVEIRGAARDLPVLLYLHGGPCMPATPFLRFHQAELSETFIVVSWDQRGCGRSAAADLRPAEMTLERHLEDAHELTLYIKETLGKERIFLVGHSWGSVLGLELARRYPDDYLAYVGVGQVVDLREGERLSRAELFARARARGDTATVQAVEANRYSPDEGYADGLQGFLAHRRLLWTYGMMDHDPSAMLRAIAAAEGYSKDVTEWMAAALHVQTALYDELMAIDFTERTAYRVPVFFFAGRHDYNTPSELAARYLETIEAPAKGFIWFECSGHSPPWEEPQTFRARLLEVLAAVSPGSPAPGSEADALSDELKLLRPFVGTWIGEFQDAGERPTIHRSWTVILDGQAIRETRTVPEVGFEAESIYYYDRAAGIVAYLGLTDNGYVGRGRIAFDGELFTQSGDQSRPDGSTGSIRVTFQFTDEGTLVNQLFNLEDGEWRTGHSVIYTQNGGVQN